MVVPHDGPTGVCAVSPEMVSGPDLGGGYLHQLTAEASGPGTRFIHHVQAGGTDAGGPPVGDPVPFGFALAGSMCPFGGRQCWHREYLIDGSEVDRVRTAYNRWRLVGSAMLEQRYRHGHRPVAAAVGELVDMVGPDLGRRGHPWYVGGSAGLWVRGIDLEPMDIDIGTDRSGAQQIAERLGPFLIEPFARTRWSEGGERWAARAFLGTVREGMLVEWSTSLGGASPRGSGREWVIGDAELVVESVEWGKRRVPASPVEFALVRCAERGRWDRVKAIADRLPDTAWDRSRLARLLADGTLSSDAIDRVHGLMMPRAPLRRSDRTGRS